MVIDIAVFTDLEAVAADADGALDREHQANLFDRLDWYRLLVKHCPLPGTPFVLRARDEQSTAWLFLLEQRRRATALANWYSFETGPITSGVVRPALFEAMARHLRIVRPSSVIDLAPLDSERLSTVVKPFRAAGWIALSREMSVNWMLTLPAGDWNAYLDKRPSRLRNILRRKLKSKSLTIKIINNFSDDIWQSYEKIYASSWKPVEGSPDFLRALARHESEAGTLRLGLAFHGEEPVAAQLWLVENGTATIHKLAHTEAWRGSSPGTILTAAMFRHAIERDKVGRIDFGTGDDAYKADWMDQPRLLYRLSLFNPYTVQGLLGAARESLSVTRVIIRRALEKANGTCENDGNRGD